MENFIDVFNKSITYEEGKIYWDYCKGYTSNLIKRLRKQGYTVVLSGAIHILKNKEGNEVTTGTSWERLLYNTAKLFV